MKLLAVEQMGNGMCAYDMWRSIFEIKGEMGKWSYKGGAGRWCVADWTGVAGGGHCNAADVSRGRCGIGRSIGGWTWTA